VPLPGTVLQVCLKATDLADNSLGGMHCIPYWLLGVWLCMHFNLKWSVNWAPVDVLFFASFTLYIIIIIIVCTWITCMSLLILQFISVRYQYITLSALYSRESFKDSIYAALISIWRPGIWFMQGACVRREWYNVIAWVGVYLPEQVRFKTGLDLPDETGF